MTPETFTISALTYLAVALIALYLVWRLDRADKRQPTIGPFGIYSLDPAPNGTSYRLVEAFETLEDARYVLSSLEYVNIIPNTYRIEPLAHRTEFTRLYIAFS